MILKTKNRITACKINTDCITVCLFCFLTDYHVNVRSVYSNNHKLKEVKCDNWVRMEGLGLYFIPEINLML